MTLAQMQRAFAEWLRSDAPEADARLGLRATSGLAVYRNTFRSQLAACLEESFERTRQWIGGEAFHEAVVRHVARVPPSSWTLDAYPRDFPETLALLYPADPEIAELAGLERALGAAFVGPDSAPLPPGRIAAADWDRARLVFTPTLDRLPLTTNAPAIWSALANGKAPPPVEILPGGGALLCWRHEEIARFRATDAAEQQAILELRAGRTFAGLCARLVGERGEEEGIAVAGGWLGLWLKEGLIADIEAGAD